MRFENKLAAKLWTNANREALERLEQYAWTQHDTLFIDVNLYRPGSDAPCHIQAYDHDLHHYLSIPVPAQ